MDGPRPQDVHLAPSLMYPVEITSVLEPTGRAVKKHSPLLQFKYWNEVPDGVPDEGEEPVMVTKEFYATFESPLDGTLVECLVDVGDRINDHTSTVLRILEPCDHSVQYGGLCALCGVSLDDADYLGYNDADRAPIAMSHDTSGLTVSMSEAERIEKSSNARLLRDRKLILVVDLDQTIIHAAVDPNIGRWINDRDSPNHESVKEVKSFMLREMRFEGPVNCWYYVKIRPGLAEFLEKMSQLFELHIYTMATKVYAKEIANLVDPDGRYFGDRILSREESGDLLQKNISRLFPVTTSLVAIIDDRGDVWQWSPHLVRVFPYNFFSGTGDINSGFLPARNGLVTPDSVENGTDSGTTPAANGGKTLHDNDHELPNLKRILTDVHKQYYEDYDKLMAMPEAKKEKELHKYSHQPFQHSRDDDIPDVGVLLPRMKSQVFDGCVFLFSGIFPLGTSLDSADIVQWVRSFGAVVVAEFIPTVTHVIADSGGTYKARQGAGAGAYVVGVNWVFKSLEDWSRADEADYKLAVPDPIKPKPAHRRSSVGQPQSNGNGADSNGATRSSQESEDDSGIDSDRPVNYDEPEAGVAANFVRSLSRGGVDWDGIDEELKELMGSDSEVDSDVFESDEPKTTKHELSSDDEGPRAKRAKADAGAEADASANAVEVENGTENAENEADEDSNDEDFAAELARGMS